MRNRMTALVAFVAALMLIAAIPAAAGGRPLVAELSGANEVPTPGDADGSGTMQLTLNQGQGEICFDLDVSNIDSPTRAHIHAAPAGVNGGVVVFFFDMVIADPIPVTFDGCVHGIDKDLIKDIRQNPQDYYINVHNAAFPGGAIRGQLSK